MHERVFIFPMGLRTSSLGIEAATESGLVLGSMLALCGLRKNR